MPQRAPRLFTAIFRAVAPAGLLLLALPVTEARAQTGGGLGSALDLIYLTAVGLPFPLLPLLAGAGLFMLTRSHLVAAGVCAAIFGAWGAFHFSRSSLDGPSSGALFGLATDGLTSGLVALAGSGYLHLISAEVRRLGKVRTAIAHGAGLAFAAIAFVLLYVTGGSDKVEIGLYAVMLVLSLAVSAATGSFGGVAVTMTLALIAMVFGLWAAALARGAPDAGQAFIAVFALPELFVPVVAAAAIGWWLGGKHRARKSRDRPG